MSSVVERDIAHIRSLHSVDLGRQRRVTCKSTKYLTYRLILRSKDRVSAVNCATSMVKDKRIEREGKIIVVDPKRSMML
jgi:hypothetical protein